MNPEKQRIAIAEACGWTKCRLTVRGNGAPGRRPSPHGVPPRRNYEAPLPDYLHDLNACHDMEKRVVGAGGTWTHYISALDVESQVDGVSMLWHATAQMRCRAFLKAINKWEESEC